MPFIIILIYLLSIVPSLCYADDASKLNIATMSQLSLAEEYEHFGVQQGPRTKLNGTFFFNNTWNIQPHTVTWFNRTVNTGDLAVSPLINQVNGLTLEYKKDNNSLDIDVGEYRDLYTVMNAYIYGAYQPFDKIYLDAKLGINQQSFLNNFMAAGGMQNLLNGSIIYQRTPNDYLYIAIEGDRYYTQNHIYLGYAKTITGEYGYKFRTDYPDYTLALLGTAAQYKTANNTLTGKVLRLVPSSLLPTTSLFVPGSYADVGLNFRFGDTGNTEYAPRLRPYFSATLYYYSPMHNTGTETSVGVASKVFGKDKLSLYVSRTTNGGPSSIDDSLGGAQYQIFW